MAQPERDQLSSLLERLGRGRLQRAVPLKGSVALPDGTRVAPWLAQTDQGVWLVAELGDAVHLRDVLDAHPLRYESRLLGDRLVLGDETFGVPVARSAEARAALGAGKVRRDHAHGDTLGAPRVPRGPWIDATSPPEEAWLDAALDPDEPVLAWLHTGTITGFEGSLEPGCEAGFRLLITRDRVALVAISALGDVAVTALPDAPLEITGGRGAAICAGDLSWEPVGNTREFLEVAPLPGATGAARLRLAAARARQRGKEGEILADHLLNRLIPDNAPIDRLIAASRAQTIHDAEVQQAVAGLPRTAQGAAVLAGWFTEWQPPLPLAHAVLGHAMAHAHDPAGAAWSLPLHRAVRDRAVAATPDRFAQAEADLSLAEHLLFAGRADEARAVLLARRPALPDEELAEVLPPEEADLTAGEGGQPIHIRLLEALARTTPAAHGDPSALAALARHQPLVPARLDALVAAASGDLAARAEGARQVVSPSGLAPSAASGAAPIMRALPPDLLPRVQHPAAREGGVLSRVQAAVAHIDPPDFGVLRSHCERVGAARHPELARAVADAAVVYGLPVPDTYLSQGDKRVGLRSHESPDPFLVVGGAHIDPDSEFALTPAELRHAVGAEVAHLRFGHSRITSNDVWTGLMDKGATAITATASLLPFLRFLPVDLVGNDRTWRVVGTMVPQSWLRVIYGVDDAAALAKVVPTDLGRLGNAGAAAVESAGGTWSTLQSAARKVLPGSPEPAPVLGDVGLDNARLVVAHRVMQLTADRGGLVLSGDLRASLRAMFLTHTRLARELAVAEAQGLAPCLGRKGPDGRLVLPDLAVRVAALVAFWLSDDFAHLRDASRSPDRGEASA